ncbi:MAG: hypothetical protein N2234_08075, partial [Planctomycetota bacterium]|nr:hypothetical protein [Planctomycetota bacterium]
TLGWSAAKGAETYEVFFGTDPVAVANATTSDPEYKGNTTSLYYTISGLSYGTDYYWRIDSKNSSGTTKGNLWTFKTVSPSANNPPSVSIQT